MNQKPKYQIFPVSSINSMSSQSKPQLTLFVYIYTHTHTHMYLFVDKGGTIMWKKTFFETQQKGRLNLRMAVI